MKKTLLFLAVALAACTMMLSAAEKGPPMLSIDVEHTVYSTFDTISGQVNNIEIGEKCIIELVDSYGHVMTRDLLKRAGVKGTPFHVQIKWFATPDLTVRVTGSGERKAQVKLLCIPPTPGWDDFLTVDASASTAATPADLALLRVLGIDTGASPGTTSLGTLASQDLRVVVTDALGSDPFVLDATTLHDSVAAYEKREKPADRSALKRSPSLGAPDTIPKAVAKVKTMLKACENYNPVAFVLCDSPGITPGNRAFDYDFDPESLSAFRTWLKDRYPSLAMLSQRWGIKAPKRWEDLYPMTTDAILAREFGKKEKKRTRLNFSPWADHLEFMDHQFSSTMSQVTERVHNEFRSVRVGFTGGLAPAAFGGYDWSSLVAAVDFAECRDEAFKRLVASLNNQRTYPGYVVGTADDSLPAGEFLRALWTGVAAGDLGVILKGGSLSAAVELKPPVIKTRNSVAALDSGFGRLLLNKDFRPTATGVAIYYSQPSVRIQFILDAHAQGDQFRLGDVSDDPWTSTWHRDIRAWMDLLDDLRTEFDFISYRRVLSDRGWMRGIKVLILPKTVALSKAEVEQLDRFVKQGGTVVADSQCALFDERGVQFADPALDNLFSIKREGNDSAELAGQYQPFLEAAFKPHAESGRFKDLTEGLPAAELSPVEKKIAPVNALYGLKSGQTHALLMRPVGTGNAVYLNLSLINYSQDRLDAKKVGALRDVVGRVLQLAGVIGGVKVVAAGGTPPPDLVVRQYTLGTNDYLFVLRHAPLPAKAEKGVREGPPPEVAPEIPEEAPEQPEPPEQMPQPEKPAQPEPPPQEPQKPEPPPPPPDQLPPVKPPPLLPPPPPRPPQPLPPQPQAPEKQNAYRGIVFFAPGDPEAKAAEEKPAEMKEEAPKAEEKKPAEGEGEKKAEEKKPAEGEGEKKAEEKKPDEGEKKEGEGEKKEGEGQKKEGEGEKVELKGDFFKIRLPRDRYVYDIIAGRLIGKTNEPLIFLPEDTSGVLALLDYEVKGIDIRTNVRGQELTYRLTLTTAGRPGMHAFRVEFLNPKGSSATEYTTTLSAPGGYASGVLNLPATEAAGDWTIKVRDAVTGTTATAKFAVK